jgi:uncharacterized Zn finger protein
VQRARPRRCPDRDVIRIVDTNRYDHALPETVVDAALPSRPHWAFRTCRAQAEPIMKEGRSGHYEDAARWLAKARTGSLAEGRAGGWQAYVDGLLDQHSRKDKLVPLIRPLRDAVPTP